MGVANNDEAPRGRNFGRWPDGDQRPIIALIVIFWLAFQSVYYAYLTFGDSSDEIDALTLISRFVHYITLPSEISIVSVGAALSAIIYLLLHAARRYPFGWQLILAAVLASAGAVLFAITVVLICDLFDVPWPGLTARFILADSMRWISSFGLWAAIVLTVTYNREIRERERRLALLQAREQDAQMRALRYQVNPHLLYNTLNSIAALILDRQNDLAEAMVLKLSAFFRASLSSDPHADVTLGEEFALQRTYLEIEQMRFPRLRAVFDADEDVLRAIVPGWILQPLVENVLKHGINPDGRSTYIAVRARRHAETLIIEVIDSGPGLSSHQGTGVGLRNVRNRLETRFGDEGRIERESNPMGGHVARLSMPWRLE